MSDAAKSEGCKRRARKITHKEKLPEDANEGRVCVLGSSQNPPAGGAEPVKGAGEGTRAAAGAAPRRDAGDGNRSQPRARGSLHALSPRRETGRVSLGPLGHIPSAERDSRILAPAGHKQTWGAETLGPWIPESGRPRPRRATTYTKTPKSRARTPISMASSRMVRPEQLPRRLRLVLSAAPPQLGRRRLSRPGAAREARSRPRVGEGGGRPEGEGSAQTSCLRLRGSETPRWPLPTLPAPSGGRLGDFPLPCAGHRLRVLSPRRALAARRGEARGSPAAAAASPARSPPVGGPWARRPGSALPGLCLRPVSSLGL